MTQLRTKPEEQRQRDSALSIQVATSRAARAGSLASIEVA
jgi:hypothetical protein